MLRHMHRSTGGPIGRPHFEETRAGSRTRWLSRRVLLTAAIAVFALSAALTVSVNAAELDTFRAEPMRLDIGTALFALLLGLAAVSLLMLRPRLPVKGRERDR
jgi:hypothetical protein